MIGGLVLAAGAGRRFGGPKALVEVAGERWVDRAARVLREGGAEPIVVVVGAAPVEVPGADSVVANPAWAEGMGSSLRAGLAAPALAAFRPVVMPLSRAAWTARCSKGSSTSIPASRRSSMLVALVVSSPRATCRVPPGCLVRRKPQ